MAIRKRFINPFGGKESAKVQATTDNGDIETPADPKHPLEKSKETDNTSSDEEIIDENAQSGTQKAQASSQAWTRNTLIAAYVL